MPIPGWDLDQTLGMSTLIGEAALHRSFYFGGQEGQGQPIRLRTSIRDDTLFVTGRNSPSCCDFFEYQVQLVGQFDSANAPPESIAYWNAWLSRRGETGSQPLPEPTSVASLGLALLLMARSRLSLLALGRR
jgi:hypothetical protein